MIVQSLRFMLADDLDLVCEADRSPSLRFILDDAEYERFVDAGGNGEWDHITVATSVIADYLFAHRQPLPRRNIIITISRPAHGCLRIALAVTDQVFAERNYPERLFHGAFRLSKHVPSVNEFFEHLLDADRATYKQALRTIARAVVPNEPPDPEYAAWQSVWASDAEERVEPEAKPTLVTPPEPSVPVPVPAPAKTGGVPAGPFKIQQLRMYASILASGKDLPSTLSEDGRNQVLAYYTQHHQAGSA